MSVRVMSEGEWAYANESAIVSKEEIAKAFDVVDFLLSKETAFDLFKSLKVGRSNDFDAIALVSSTSKDNCLLERSVLEYLEFKGN